MGAYYGLGLGLGGAPVPIRGSHLAVGGLIDQFDGAAAAYSLRSLRSNTGNVVRVRRASDNDEKDFTASQIESGEMVNWVNSQTVPPLDIGIETSEGRIPVPEGGTSIGTPAAAYSLRNLSTAYTGNVVDVRRSSDGAEESFTAAEVSDGTLEAWVTAPVSSLIGNRMYFDGVDDSVTLDSPVNLTGNFEITGTILVNSFSNINPIAGLSTSATDRIFINATSARWVVVIDGNAAFFTATTQIEAQTLYSYSISRSGSDVTVTVDGVGSETLTVSASDFDLETVGNYQSNFLNGLLTVDFGNETVFDGTITGGDTIGTVTGSPELFTGQGFDGTVSKWYDQSGNDNHAVQTTPANQPTIVEGGSLVTNDGNAVVNFSSIDNRHFIFGAGIDLTARTVFYAGRPTSANFHNLLGNTSNASANFIRTSNNAGGRVWLTDPSSSIFVDGSVYVDGDTRDQGYSLNTFVLDSDATVNFLGGTSVALSDTPIVDASEIIIYDSDQSDNRTAIEANIGETYGITGIPAYDNTVDGFVETWYDQSGNGNDATQSVAASQPKIVDGGSLVSGGIDFDGVDDSLDAVFVKSFDGLSAFIAAQTYTTGVILGLGTNPRWYLPRTLNSVEYWGYNDSAVKINGGASVARQELFTGISGSTTATFYRDGTSVGTATATDGDSSDIIIGSGGGLFSDAEISEIIIYDSDQSATRTGIESNINAHYSIYP